jgi:sulfide:quinone oxidoreductase
MKRLVILGAGTGGTVMANLLRKRLAPAEWSITVVDRDTAHYYQPGFLFVPFGIYAPRQLVKDRAKLLPKGVEFVVAPVEGIDHARNEVRIGGGEALPYDLLIVATGCDIKPDETPGMLDGWRDTVFDFFTPDGSAALAPKLAAFKGGTLAVHVNEMPIKCPVAPLEFTFLSDWYFTKRKIREAVNIVFVTTLPGAFTKPVAAAALGALLDERRIRVVPDFGTERIDAAARKIVGYDGREVPYDLLVTVPTNMGAEVIERSGLGNELRFIPTDPKTLRSKKHENIFVLGDATDLPSSKAGSVVHFQAEILAENVERAIAGKPLAGEFDGHANCFVETGRGRAILIDFNYDVEPLPGRFPFPVVGPLPLLKPSRLNHWGKLAFRWIYWHMMIKGRPIPFIPAQMKMAGKRRPQPPAAPTAAAPDASTKKETR